jgi:hypothetical protein
MAFDPTGRLRRPLPGARLADDERAVSRLFVREQEQARRELVPARDKVALKMVVRRNTARVASCAPNAPLLIRIVRYPFRLETVRGTRRKYLERAERFERVQWSAEVAAALADRERLRFTSAGRGRPQPFAVRPSTWAILPPDGTDSGDER